MAREVQPLQKLKDVLDLGHHRYEGRHRLVEELLLDPEALVFGIQGVRRLLRVDDELEPVLVSDERIVLHRALCAVLDLVLDLVETLWFLFGLQNNEGTLAHHDEFDDFQRVFCLIQAH